jgi:hypothetical protein
MASKKNPDEKPLIVLDKRLSERQKARGKITPTEYEAHLAALPDLADKADNIASLVYPAGSN